MLMSTLAAAQAPGPQACAQALLIYSVAPKTLVPLLMDKERACRLVLALEHRIQATAPALLKSNAVSVAVLQWPKVKGSTSAIQCHLQLRVVS